VHQSGAPRASSRFCFSAAASVVRLAVITPICHTLFVMTDFMCVLRIPLLNPSRHVWNVGLAFGKRKRLLAPSVFSSYAYPKYGSQNNECT